MAKITLTDVAAERIGVETAAVAATTTGSPIVPFSAIIYDTKGDSFTYTNPEPLVFVRQSVRVETVRGDRAVLQIGPPRGTQIVTIGASQLLGIELGIGNN